MQPVSTYGALLTQINVMTSTTTTTQKLALQLSSGKIGVDYADNPNRSQVLDLTSTQDQLNSYVRSCTTGDITSSLYTNSLSQILTIAQNALKSVESLKTSYSGLTSLPAATATNQNQIDAYNSFQNLGQTINQAMTETTISLNEQTPSGGYLYGGLRNPTANQPQTAGGTAAYNFPPAVDLTSLPYFLATGNNPAPNPAGTATPWKGYTPPQAGMDAITTTPTLPTYDVDLATAAPASTNYPTAGALAWGTQSVTVDQNQTVGLNISSTNSAFQNLVNGLRAAKTAADQAGNYSTKDRDNYMTMAYSSLSAAVTGIQSLQQQNALTDLTFQTKLQVHDTNLSMIETQINNATVVDTTTVTAELAAVDNQLQASYKATSSLLSMSLMNYLK